MRCRGHDDEPAADQLLAGDARRAAGEEVLRSQEHHPAYCKHTMGLLTYIWWCLS